MEALMRMEDEEGKRLSEDEVLDNIVTLVVAGYTSTSVAIMWAFYYLAKNPHVLLKLREEHMLIGKKLQGSETLLHMKRLHHVYTLKRWKMVNPNVEMTYLPHPNLADELEIEITRI